MNLSSDTNARCIRAAQGMLEKHISMLAFPPILVEQVAQSLGFQVVQILGAGGEFSGLVSPEHKLIGVNGNHHVHRQRFTIAHELGHIVLNHPSESRCTSRKIAELNREADVCASEILMPSRLLTPLLEGPRTVSVGTLSKLFDVSEEAMALKIHQINEFRSTVRQK